MASVQPKEHSESDSSPMAQDIDWLHCRASLCKVNLFSNDKLKSEKERKLVCFVDVSSLNERGGDQNSPSDTEPADGFDLEEKEIVIIKDENENPTNTEGSVCFFKPGHCEKGNVMSWLSDDLQKYAIGFHHALTPANNPQKPNSFDSAADIPSPNNTAACNRSGA